MENLVLEFDQQKNRIEENLKYIKANLDKVEGPIFIELIGTPKSGKTTLLGYFKNLFEKNNIKIQTRQETAEYNPIEDKSIEEYGMWMFMELMQKLSEDISNKNPRIVIYDRGILDRVPWLDHSVNDGSMTLKDTTLLKQLYKTDFLQKYKPLVYVLITSPELSVERKGKPGRLVNVESMRIFNSYLEKEQPFLENASLKYSIIHTDPYQGKLQKFIMNIIEIVTEDVKQQIKEREFSSVGGETPAGSER